MKKCEQLERLFAAGAPERDWQAHRQVCAECAALGDRIDALLNDLEVFRLPEPSSALTARLTAIPRRTVSCQKAADWMALAIDDGLSPSESERLAFHLRRCVACREASESLGLLGELARPQPAPGLLTRTAATRPSRKRGWLRRFSDPRTFAFAAYAAAVVLLIVGGNAADLANRTGAVRLGDDVAGKTRQATAALADRLGQEEERLFRAVAVAKGNLVGYSRAAVSMAGTVFDQLRTEVLSLPDRDRRGAEASRSKAS
jgi:Putative zinc-finger